MVSVTAIFLPSQPPWFGSSEFEFMRRDSTGEGRGGGVCYSNLSAISVWFF